MNTLRTHAPRLLAGLSLVALVGGVGLAASRPAHTAGGPVPVSVTNTVSTLAADSPDKQPFVQSLALTTLNGDGATQTIHVPAGKRLVVETVTAFRSAVAQPSVNAQIYLRASVNGQSGLFAPPLLTGSNRIVTEPLRFRADPNTDVLVIASLTGPVTSEEDDVTLSGYLVDVP